MVKSENTGEKVHGGNPWLASFTIAATLAAVILINSNHTGACLNPAVAIAQHVLSYGLLDGVGSPRDDGFFKVYLLGPILGGILAGFFSWAHDRFVYRYAGERKEYDD